VVGGKNFKFRQRKSEMVCTGNMGMGNVIVLEPRQNRQSCSGRTVWFPQILYGTVWLPEILPLHSEKPDSPKHSIASSQLYSKMTVSHIGVRPRKYVLASKVSGRILDMCYVSKGILCIWYRL